MVFFFCQLAHLLMCTWACIATCNVWRRWCYIIITITIFKLHFYTGGCSIPGTRSGLTRSISGYAVGDTVTYTCQSGYILSGSSTRTCQTSGYWTGSIPTCISKCIEIDRMYTSSYYILLWYWCRWTEYASATFYCKWTAHSLQWHSFP